MPELTKEFLYYEYIEKEKSIYIIADEQHTYPNKIRRLLIKYGIPLRNKSQAQTAALLQGRHKHPTKGKPRSEETKEKIRKAIYDSKPPRQPKQPKEPPRKPASIWPDIQF